MPRGRLSEPYVRDKALEYLKTFYQEEHQTRNVVTKPEAVVRPKYGRGRADGIVAFHREDPGSVFVVSVEAKSVKTIGALVPRERTAYWGFHATLVGLCGLVPSVLFALHTHFWLWRWVLPPVVFFVVAGAYIMFTAQQTRYARFDVVDQVLRYPAHERWLAFSTDAFNWLGHDRRRSLLAKCEKLQIGIVLVSANAPCKVVHRPTSKEHKAVDYLRCYVKAEEIRQQLAATSE